MSPFDMLLLSATAGGLDNLGAVFTQIGTWLSSMVTTITEAPILLVGLGFFAFGGVIGLAYRLIRG